MAGIKQETKSAITLKGSATIIAEFLDYGVNSILYQRGIYPAENFAAEQKYGLTILKSADDKVKEFLQNVLEQTRDWIATKKIQKITMVICHADSKEVLECWDFNLKLEDKFSGEIGPSGDAPMAEKEVVGQKDLKVIQTEIRDVIRQITGCVTFLPMLDCPCSFDIQVYTDNTAEVPEGWEESTPKIISNCQELKLRSFSTSVHKLETAVCYKVNT